MLELFKERKAAVADATKSVKAFISSITDDKSFVELDTYRFSKNELFEDAEAFGEGVVTGYARIGDKPVYMAVQNTDALKGGLTKAQADKILKCMDLAEKSNYPMISILSSTGARIGEGLSVLEGYAELIARSSALYGVIPQISIIRGECYGAISYFASLSDIVITMKEGKLATTSVGILSATLEGGKEFGCGANDLLKNGLASFSVEDSDELFSKLDLILELLSDGVVELDEPTLNRLSKLENYKVSDLVANVFDEGTFIEFGAEFGSELCTALGRIGGFTVGAILCGDQPDGVKLTRKAAKKASKFIRFVNSYEIPVVTFVNTCGVITCTSAEENGLMKDVANLMSAVADTESCKIAVVTGKAQGSGYIALASKSLGFDYTLAWANAAISVVSDVVGANTLFAGEIAASSIPSATRTAVTEKYAKQVADPFNAAHDGLLDNIIEPSMTRQYIISALMMLNV